jgi:hypothetical protein
MDRFLAQGGKSKGKGKISTEPHAMKGYWGVEV